MSKATSIILFEKNGNPIYNLGVIGHSTNGEIEWE
jgi:hypothetical protein